MGQKSRLLDLPTELLHHIIAFLPIQALSHLAYVSQYLQDLAVQSLHTRLRHATRLQDRRVTLECYHPSARWSSPWLPCNYLVASDLGYRLESEGFRALESSVEARQGCLQGLYSHFRPHYRHFEAARRFQIASDRHSLRPFSGPSISTTAGSEPIVARFVNLDAGELFSQLCVRIDLTQLGPREGVFSTLINLLDKLTLRIWRDWLYDHAKGSVADREYRGKGHPQYNDVLWLDEEKEFGLRVRVVERMWRRSTPILYDEDEEQAVSFELGLEELLIRTSRFLLAIEESFRLQENDSGKAMIFDSFYAVNE